MNIPFHKPVVPRSLNEIYSKSIKTGWLTTGPEAIKFEKIVSEYTFSKYTVAVNSCTAALHLALKCFDFPEGKKVLVPSLTFSATASSILYNSLTPVFVDSDPVTLGMSI